MSLLCNISNTDIKLEYNETGQIEVASEKRFGHNTISILIGIIQFTAKNLLISLTDRAVLLVYAKNGPKNIKIFKKVLKANNYPHTLI